MRKILFYICILGLSVGLVGCKGQTTSKDDSEEPDIRKELEQSAGQDEASEEIPDEGYIGTAEMDDREFPLVVHDGVSYLIYEDEGVAKVMSTMASDELLESYVIRSEVSFDGKTYPVTEICDEGFYGYDTMRTVVLPDSIVKIGASAFDGCMALEEFVIPASVTAIGNDAFLGCESLKEIVIPASVKELGNDLFFDCTGLERVVFEEGIELVPSETFSNCDALTDIVLPSTIKLIGYEAFWYCESLKELSLPEGLLAIESRAFYDCLGLESLRLPKSLQTIEPDIFDFCDNLAALYVPEEKVGEYSDLFYGYELDIIGY